jgi:hypothetical protein
MAILLILHCLDVYFVFFYTSNQLFYVARGHHVSAHLVECLILEEGVEGALPLLIIQRLQELLDGGGDLGLCTTGGSGGGCGHHSGAGGNSAEEAGTCGTAAAARAAHTVAEVLQIEIIKIIY